MVLVLDVGGGSPEAAVDYYRSVGGGDYLYAMDRGFRVAQSYEVFTLGATVIVNPVGVVSFRDPATTPADVLEREVREALG